MTPTNGTFGPNITYYDDRDGLLSQVTSQMFRYCTNLQWVNLPAVTEIRDYAFQESGLTGNITFPSCISILDNSFRSLINSPNISFPVLSSATGINIFVGPTNYPIFNIPISFLTSNNGLPADFCTIPTMGKSIINYIGYSNTAEYNTELGNLGSIITNKGHLAWLIGLGSGAIINFQIVGENIRFLALKNYALKVQAFYNNSTTYPITFFDDIGMKVSNLNDASINLCSTIKWVKFNGIVNLTGNSILRECQLLNNVELNNVKTCSSNPILRDSYNMINLNFPELLTMTGNFYSAGIKTFNAPKCTTLGASTGNDGIFNTNGIALTLPVILKTNNNGAPDGDIQNVLSKSGSVNYID